MTPAMYMAIRAFCIRTASYFKGLGISQHAAGRTALAVARSEGPGCGPACTKLPHARENYAHGRAVLAMPNLPSQSKGHVFH